MLRAMDRPRPEPPVSRLRLVSSRRNGSNTRFHVLGGDARPVIVDIDLHQLLAAAGAGVTRAASPYFSALPTRLVSARFSASGRACTVRWSGPVIGQRVGMLRVAVGGLVQDRAQQDRRGRCGVTASLVAMSRPKASVAATIASISSRSASIFVRCSSSSIYSARSFSRVIGVRRSWPMAVSRKVRSCDEAADARGHGVEGDGGGDDFAGPGLRQGGRVATSRPSRSAAAASVRTGTSQLPHRPDDHAPRRSTVITMKAVAKLGERQGCGGGSGEVMVSQVTVGGRSRRAAGRPACQRRRRSGGWPSSGGSIGGRPDNRPSGRPKLMM